MTTVEVVFEGCRREGVTLRADNNRLTGNGARPSQELEGTIKLNSKKITTAITLQTRLEAGELKIHRMERAGEDITALEAFWIDLLHDYERAINTEIEYLT